MTDDPSEVLDMPALLAPSRRKCSCDDDKMDLEFIDRVAYYILVSSRFLEQVCILGIHGSGIKGNRVFRNGFGVGFGDSFGDSFHVGFGVWFWCFWCWFGCYFCWVCEVFVRLLLVLVLVLMLVLVRFGWFGLVVVGFGWLWLVSLSFVWF